MALVKCEECAKEISESAKVCPQCGYKPRRTSRLTWLVTIAIAIIIIAVFETTAHNQSTPLATETPEQAAQRNKQDEAIQRALADRSQYSADQKASANAVIENLKVFASREALSNIVYYDWLNEWYTLDFDTQYKLISSAADAEIVMSDGKIKVIKFEYARTLVAEATPSGGVKVLKHRP